MGKVVDSSFHLSCDLMPACDELCWRGEGELSKDTNWDLCLDPNKQNSKFRELHVVLISGLEFSFSKETVLWVTPNQCLGVIPGIAWGDACSASIKLGIPFCMQSIAELSPWPG